MKRGNTAVEMTIDVPLARKVCDIAESEELMRHEQSRWFSWPVTVEMYPGELLRALPDHIAAEIHTAVEMRMDAIPLAKLQSCGTSACLGGITALLTAPEGTWYRNDDGILLFPDGTSSNIFTYAMNALSLSFAQARSVFQEWDAAVAIDRLRGYADVAEGAL